MYFSVTIASSTHVGNADIDLPSGWFHLFFNVMGSSLKVYFNATMVAQQRLDNFTGFTVGEGRVVIGRRKTDLDLRYTSIQVDELRFFNKYVFESQIIMLSQLPN